MEPWMGQVGVAGGLLALLLALGKAFIASIDRRVAERTAEHVAELARIKEQHERELADMRARAEAWEATATRRESTVNELVMQTGRLQGTSDTAVQLLRAIHQMQGRELEQ